MFMLFDFIFSYFLNFHPILSCPIRILSNYNPIILRHSHQHISFLPTLPYPTPFSLCYLLSYHSLPPTSSISCFPLCYALTYSFLRSFIHSFLPSFLPFSASFLKYPASLSLNRFNYFHYDGISIHQITILKYN